MCVEIKELESDSLTTTHAQCPLQLSHGPLGAAASAHEVLSYLYKRPSRPLSHQSLPHWVEGKKGGLPHPCCTGGDRAGEH